MKKSTKRSGRPQPHEPSTKEGACLVRLRAAIPDTPPSGKRVIEFILTQPELGATLSIEGLAKRCRTSPSSITRLCRSLNYDGYRDFQRDLIAARAAVPAVLDPFSSGESSANIMAQVFECNRRSLADTERVLSTRVMVGVAKRIERAPRTIFMGIGESAAVSDTAAQRLASLGLATAAISDPYSHIFVSGNAAKKEVVVGISHTGQTALIVDALQTARARGAYTVAVTNYPRSPLAKASDAVLQTAFEEHRISAAVSSSRIAQSCVIDCLYFLLAHSMSATATKLSRASEKRVERMIRVSDR